MIEFIVATHVHIHTHTHKAKTALRSVGIKLCPPATDELLGTYADFVIRSVPLQGNFDVITTTLLLTHYHYSAALARATSCT